jgi:hypothetical protein
MKPRSVLEAQLNLRNTLSDMFNLLQVARQSAVDIDERFALDNKLRALDVSLAQLKKWDVL